MARFSKRSQIGIECIRCSSWPLILPINVNMRRCPLGCEKQTQVSSSRSCKRFAGFRLVSPRPLPCRFWPRFCSSNVSPWISFGPSRRSPLMSTASTETAHAKNTHHPLQSIWLGYSALTRATWARVPLAGLWSRIICLRWFGEEAIKCGPQALQFCQRSTCVGVRRASSCPRWSRSCD
jgi:hypothetical protein